MSFQTYCHCENSEWVSEAQLKCAECFDEYIRIFRGFTYLATDRPPKFPEKEDSYWEIYQRNLQAERGTPCQ